MSGRKVQATKNYRMFCRSGENRPLDLKKHQKLLESMKLYGFLACFPIVCVRDSTGQLIVKDGQHRLAIAESIGLTVHWLEEEVDFDVAVINCTSKTWVLRDYAQKFAANGNAEYQIGLDFADRHHLPVGTAFALLAGTTGFSNCDTAFLDGSFQVKDQPWANAVAGIYSPLVARSPSLRHARFLEACMACCRVASFDSKRLLQNAERCRDKLVSYSTRDAYLDMLEAVYNFGRVKLVGLKIEAVLAMRERNVANKKKQPSKQAVPA